VTEINSYEDNGSEGSTPPPGFWEDFTVLGVPQSDDRDPLEEVRRRLEPDYKQQAEAYC